MTALTEFRRALFAGVERAVRANPFSAERESADAALRTLGGGEPLEVVVVQLEALRQAGAHRLPAYAENDGRLLRAAVLFVEFHRAIPHFDAFIVQQHARGDDCCPVTFASDVIDALVAHGFAEGEAVRLFELFYQLRRAFFFIDRELPGASPCMRDLRCRLWENLFTTNVYTYERHLWRRMEDFSTLLLGETGTGKGSAAAAIGRSGFIPYDRQRGAFAQSFSEAFVAITLTGFPEALIESELFGHRRGAFTGAIDRHEGVLDRCSAHGAVLLDEIGDVPLPIQVKLLQVLQTRIFSPVGSHEKRRFEGRVIAATNRDIERLRREGQFREDFYYRLCSDRIELPTLRQRLVEDSGELPLLVGRILTRLCGPDGASLTARTCEGLLTGVGAHYAWPGNVRELEQAVRRVLLRGRYEPAGATAPTDADGAAGFAGEVAAGTLDARDLVAGYCGMLFARLGSYGAVARLTGLDWRTVKRHIATSVAMGGSAQPPSLA
jgi:hypothetical protein